MVSLAEVVLFFPESFFRLRRTGLGLFNEPGNERRKVKREDGGMLPVDNPRYFDCAVLSESFLREEYIALVGVSEGKGRTKKSFVGWYKEFCDAVILIKEPKVVLGNLKLGWRFPRSDKLAGRSFCVIANPGAFAVGY